VNECVVEGGVDVRDAEYVFTLAHLGAIVHMVDLLLGGAGSLLLLIIALYLRIVLALKCK
jgi:hypothetical protein